MALPYNIFDNFEEMHVRVVWEELKVRFGFNVVSWKKRFSEYLSKQPRNTHELDAFLKFGVTFLNPVINQVLCREPNHPTFMKLIEYILNRYPGKKQQQRYNPRRPATQAPGSQTA
jgi:hypothetical protein